MFSYDVNEMRVYAHVFVQLRMERRDKLIALPCRNNMSIDNSQSPCVTIHLINIWCTDEGHRDVVSYLLHLVLGIETSKLAAVCVTAHIDVHCRQAVEILSRHLACQKYQSRTGTEDRQSFQYVVAYRLKQV